MDVSYGLFIFWKIRLPFSKSIGIYPDLPLRCSKITNKSVQTKKRSSERNEEDREYRKGWDVFNGYVLGWKNELKRIIKSLETLIWSRKFVLSFCFFYFIDLREDKNVN